MGVEYLKRVLLVISTNENKSLWIKTLEIKNLYKVYEIRDSGVRGFEVEYPEKTARIKDADIPNSGICWVSASHNVLCNILEILKESKLINKIDIEDTK